MAPNAILLAEDNPDDALIFEMMFRRAKLPQSLHIVHDGQEAIDWLSAKGEYTDRAKFPMPGLLLLDLKMPIKTGFEVLEWLRDQKTRQDLPVIILSSSDDAKDLQRARELGATAYFAKSAELRDVLEHLREMGCS